MAKDKTPVEPPRVGTTGRITTAQCVRAASCARNSGPGNASQDPLGTLRLIQDYVLGEVLEERLGEDNELWDEMNEDDCSPAITPLNGSS